MPLPLRVVTALGTGPLSMRLGRYHLADCLGGGPTGEVYRAKVYGVAGLDREFAVKRFHPSLAAKPGVVAAIHSAARLYGALEHPRVARLHEVGEASGYTFVASEFVEGSDLAQLIEQGPLPSGTAAQLIMQVGRAVGYAHGRGLSHLGLCPTNIICTLRGDVKVTDFGFLPARLPQRPASDPTLAGRLPYLAPEQLEGQATSPATDVYQLGVIAYRLMVGRMPYAITEAAALSKAMLTQAPEESGLGKHFEKLFKRALARSPFERFPDAGALADAMEAALRASPLPGSLADAGKAVSKRQAFLLAQRDTQASGVLSFPIPSPPLAAQNGSLSDTAPSAPRPTLPAAKAGATTKLGMIPAIPARRESTSEMLASSPIPFAGDTDIDAAEVGDRALSFSDQVTIPEHELIGDAPELSEDILLGPAGTDMQTHRGQFIGAHLGQGSDDDAETLIRDDSGRAASNDEGETFVKQELGAGRARISESAPLEISELSGLLEVSEDGELLSEPSPFANDRRSVDNLEELEDEVSEMLQIPLGAPMAVEVPHFPTPSLGPNAAQRGMPREIPPPQAQHLPPPGRSHTLSRPSGTGRRLLFGLVLIALALGGFLGYGLLIDSDTKSSSKPRPAVAEDAGSTIALVSADAGALPALEDAGPSAVVETPPPASLDAGAAVVALPSDTLEIDSQPQGAQIYLDGTLVGKTPIEMEPSDDSHRVAVIMPGYDLYTGEIQGKGVFKFELAEVSPSDGPYGIKVRCVPRNKDRYYIFLDGKPMGQLCPSERIGVDKGKHEIEIYDPITDSRRVFSVVAEFTGRSHRLLVD